MPRTKAMFKREQVFLPWPHKGIVEATAHSAQPELTTVMSQNVRNREGVGDRYRGGQRPGIAKYMGSQINGAADIQDINHLVIAQAYSGATTITARAVTALAVAGGTIVKFSATGTTAVTGGACLSATAPVIFSAPHFGYMYYVDGAAAKYYTATTNVAADWEAALTAGSFPKNGTAYPRLICMWRGRIVLAGISADAHNWFMSAVNDPLDFDYGATPITASIAVAGNNSPTGRLDDVITGLLPYNDDVMIFFGDHSVWSLTGDPMTGGVFDRIAQVGAPFGRPFCMDTTGGIYYFGNDREIYRLQPGQPPQNLTVGRLDRSLKTFDLSDVLIRMAWSQDEQGLYVWITPVSGNIETFNLFWDSVTDSWWIDRYGDADDYPRAVHVFDGDDPDDRAILIGCKDGYIKKPTTTAMNDDGTEIESYVYLGPISPGGRTMPYILDSFQGCLGTGSADVSLSFFSGSTDELSLTDNTGSTVSVGRVLGVLIATDYPPTHGAFLLIPGTDERTIKTWTLEADRNRTTYIRRRASTGYIKLENSAASTQWAMEWLAVNLDILHKDRRVFW
jgi:hypothetical protein